MLSGISNVEAGANEQAMEHARASHYELRFSDLFNAGRGLAFPCDARGHVDIDRLTERARVNYLYARTTIGRVYGLPVTRQVAGDFGGE